MLARIDSRFDQLEGTVGRNQRLRPSGAASVQRLGVDWREFFSRGQTIELLPVDLNAWLREEWLGVLEQAKTRVITVTVHLPNVNGMAATTLGALELRTGHTSARLKQDFGDAVQAIKQDWSSGDVQSGSRLIIHTYDRPGGFGLCLTEENWALLIPAVSGPIVVRPNLVIIFEQGGDPNYIEWARAQPAHLGSELFDEVIA